MSSSSATTIAAAEPPAQSLAALRAELDRVDDALHDALMRRAELVAQVAALRAKGPTPMRPGREAAILRRLLARNRAPLDPKLVVRVWREMISGFTVQQHAIRVAVESEELVRAAVAQFGWLAELTVASSASEAIEALAAGRAQAALLRWPGAWWAALLEQRATTVHVVARLPFCGPADGVAGFVLTQAPPDPSGDDRTLVAAPLSGSRLQSALMQAGLPVAELLTEMHGLAAMAALDGFVAADDQRLASVSGALVLGAYAAPVGERS